MADDVDLANDFIDNEVSRALSEIRKKTTSTSGSKTCRVCEEKIPSARRKLGFHLCVGCAEETERRKSLYADY